MATFPNITVGTEWVDLYTVAGATVGTAIQLQNITDNKSPKFAVIIQESATQPAANNTDGKVIYPELTQLTSTALVEAGSGKVWLRNQFGRPAIVAAGS